MYKISNFAQNDYRGEIMKNRRLKKSVVYILYALSFVVVLGTIYMLDVISKPKNLKNDNTYVNSLILEDVLPVISTKEFIIKPFVGEDKILYRLFYEANADEETQKKSLIYYQGTYIPNSGADYKCQEPFNVVAVLNGKVTKISENQLLGNIIEITHSNNLISTYQSMGEILVKEGEHVLQGQIIGKSGMSNIDVTAGNHLHFEIIYNGENINPERNYGKTMDEL